MKNDILLEKAIKASVAAGKLLLENYNDNLQATRKESARDVVTEIDRLAENEIIGILTADGKSDSIMTEEQGWIGGKASEDYWLIDALDGTVNYINHIPFFAVSMAYIQKNVITTGAIYVPMFDDLYFGSRDTGAFKNHQQIKAKDVPLSDSLFAVSFSGKRYDTANRQAEFNLFAEVNDVSRGCLRTGSASLNLALLAEGRLSGCWGKATKHWDIAAGLLLAELTGNKVRVKPEDDSKKMFSYLACGETLWNELYPIVNNVLQLDKNP